MVLIHDRVWYDRLHFALEDSMKLLTLFKMLRTCVTRETCGAKVSYSYLEEDLWCLIVIF